MDWDSVVDLGLGTISAEVRMIPCDDATGILECGVPDSTGIFQVSN